MRLLCRKNGFSLVETLAVISVITILAAMVVGVGKQVKDQGNIKLTKSTIDILVTAVEMYYQDESRMPFNTGSVGSSISQAGFESRIGGSRTRIEIILGSPVNSDWSSEALYYFLTKSLNSKRLINTITDSLVTSRDAAGDIFTVEIYDTDPVTSIETLVETVNLPRFVDAWGNTLRYNYISGATFCVISSPGKDKLYGTGDDINNLK